MTPQSLITIPQRTAVVPVEDATRREFLSSVLAAAFVVACSNDDGDDSPSSEATPGRRSVDDAMGTLTVPSDPQRVVILGQATLPTLLHLGFPSDRIVGYTFGKSISYAPFQYMGEKVQGLQIANVGDFWEPDNEAILALNPDLIITFMDTREQIKDHYQKLKSAFEGLDIPVFAYSWTWASLDEALEMLHGVSRAVNLEERAAQIDAHIRELIATTKQRIAATPPRTAQIIRVFPNDGTIQSRYSMVLDLLGVPGNRPAADPGYLALSPERLRELDADVLFVASNTTAEEAQPVTEALPNWNQLPAVIGGRVVYGENAVWLFSTIPALEITLADTAAALLD